MDRVKIYSKYDLTTNMNINNIINFTNNFNYEIEEYNINDVLEYFNIIKFTFILYLLLLVILYCWKSIVNR